jgi:hypothetical protein
MKQSKVETGINRSILINCLVGNCPFPALNGHHHERRIKVFSFTFQLGFISVDLGKYICIGLGIDGHKMSKHNLV